MSGGLEDEARRTVRGIGCGVAVMALAWLLAWLAWSWLAPLVRDQGP